MQNLPFHLILGSGGIVVDTPATSTGALRSHLKRVYNSLLFVNFLKQISSLSLYASYTSKYLKKQTIFGILCPFFKRLHDAPIEVAGVLQTNLPFFRIMWKGVFCTSNNLDNFTYFFLNVTYLIEIMLKFRREKVAIDSSIPIPYSMGMNF